MSNEQKPEGGSVGLHPIVGLLRTYRPTDEWGNGVHHLICDDAADEIERLREQMERAAIACAHLEAQAARQILLDALTPNNTLSESCKND